MSSNSHESAEQFYAIMPHALSLETLAEYGLEVSPEQAQQITREMLSLNLYWIHCALNANLPGRDAERVFGKLQRRIEVGWASEFMLRGHDVKSYWIEMEERRKVYDEIMRSGGTPPSLYLEATALLESAQIAQAEDRQKLLALCIDLIPEETIGEVAAAIELTDASDN